MGFAWSRLSWKRPSNAQSSECEEDLQFQEYRQIFISYEESLKQEINSKKSLGKGQQVLDMDDRDQRQSGSESNTKDIIHESNRCSEDSEPSRSPSETSDIEELDEAEQWSLVLGDIRLTSEGASCLENEGWLLDVAIEFFLEHLCRIKWIKHKDDIGIIGPCVAQMLKMCKNDEEIVEQLKPLNLTDKNLVLIPVNNAQEEESGGCHWSILIFYPEKEIFHHIDTLYPINKQCAWKIAEQMVTGLDLDNGTFDHHEEMQKYQQDNKFDCGLFVLENAERAIIHTFVEQNDGSNFEPCHKTFLDGKREELQEILKNLKLKFDF